MLCFGHPFGLLLTDPIGRDRAPPKKEEFSFEKKPINKMVRSIFYLIFRVPQHFRLFAFPGLLQYFFFKNRKKLLKYRKLYRTLENNFLDFFRIILVFFTFFKVNFGEFSFIKLHKNSEKSSKNLKKLPKIRKTLAINFRIIKIILVIFFYIFQSIFACFYPKNSFKKFKKISKMCQESRNMVRTARIWCRTISSIFFSRAA